MRENTGNVLHSTALASTSVFFLKFWSCAFLLAIFLFNFSGKHQMPYESSLFLDVFRLSLAIRIAVRIKDTLANCMLKHCLPLV